MRGVSVTAAWYHRDTYNMTQSVNGPFTPADYTIVNVVSPLDGSIIPAYNLNSAKQGLVDRVDVNSTDSESAQLLVHRVRVRCGGAHRDGRRCSAAGRSTARP